MGATSESLALGLISVIQASHSLNENDVLERYCAYREARGESADRDGVRALLRTFEEVGGSEQWGGKVAHFRRRYMPDPALARQSASAEIAASEIEHAAELFYRHRVDSIADLRDALRDSAGRELLWTALTKISGNSQIWSELLDRVGIAEPALVG